MKHNACSKGINICGTWMRPTPAAQHSVAEMLKTFSFLTLPSMKKVHCFPLISTETFMYTGHGVMEGMWKSEGNLWEFILSFHHASFGDWTQVTGLGGSRFYPMLSPSPKCLWTPKGWGLQGASSHLTPFLPLHFSMALLIGSFWLSHSPQRQRPTLLLRVVLMNEWNRNWEQRVLASRPNHTVKNVSPNRLHF